jgi:anti-sigma factor RsiW
MPFDFVTIEKDGTMNNKTTPGCNMHEALMAYLYDEAAPEEAARVRAHIVDCASCSDELAGFERLRGMLQTWQVEDMPLLRIAAQQPRQSTLTLLKELFLALPLWTRSAAALATAILVLAIAGTDISIGSGSVAVRFGHFNRESNPVESLTRAQVETLVNELVAAMDAENKAEIEKRVAQLETSLQGVHSADLARIGLRLKEQQAKIQSLERDIDRRGGMSIADLLLSSAAGSESSPDSGLGDGQ